MLTLRLSVVNCGAIALLLSSCSSQSKPSEQIRHARTDSAGLAVTEIWVPEESRHSHWLPSPDPAYVAGVDNDTLYGVAAAVRLPDGGIVSVSPAAHEMRRFDQMGKLQWTVGRRGEGPGEFQLPGSICLAGDTLIVGDYARIHFFSTTGALIRTFVPRFTEGVLPAGVWRCGGDGAMAAQTFASVDWLQRAAAVWRDSAELYWLPRGSDSARIIQRIPVDEYYLARLEGSSNPARRRLPGGRVTIWSVRGERAYIGVGDGFELQLYERNAVGVDAWRQVAIIRIVGRDQNLSPASIAAFERDLERQRLSSDPDRIDPAVSTKAPYPATIPPYDALLIGNDGDLWIREYRWQPASDEEQSWLVLSSTGEFHAHVRIPAELVVLDVGTNTFVTRVRDSLGLEQLRVYAILRSDQR